MGGRDQSERPVAISWNGWSQSPGARTQGPGRNGRINSSFIPPRGFIAVAMDLAMMSSAQRHGELVADLAPEHPTLCEARQQTPGRVLFSNRKLLQWINDDYV
jgi:hypothetical protein